MLQQWKWGTEAMHNRTALFTLRRSGRSVCREAMTESHCCDVQPFMYSMQNVLNASQLCAATKEKKHALQSYTLKTTKRQRKPTTTLVITKTLFLRQNDTWKISRNRICQRNSTRTVNIFQQKRDTNSSYKHAPPLLEQLHQAQSWKHKRGTSSTITKKLKCQYFNKIPFMLHGINKDWEEVNCN